MATQIIAVPSNNPGGMDATVGDHFGHCELYTLVKVTEGEIDEVYTIPNVPHQHGGCMAPVNYLAENGVNALIAGGMGMRPLMGMNQVGIQVYYGAGAPSVGAAIGALLQGQLQVFTPQNTCGGGA